MSFFQTPNPAFPLWAILSIAAAVLIVITMHLTSLPGAPMPPSRRRIRMANGVLLMVLTLLLTYALGFVGMLPSGGGSIGHIRAFVLVWVAIIGVLPLVLGLAALDMVNTVRLQREALRARRRELRMQMLREVDIRVKARLAGVGGGGRARTGGAGNDANGS